MKARGMTLVFSLFLSLVSFQQAAAQSRGGNPPPQLVITRATADLDAVPPTLLIEGSNFGGAPSVSIGAAGGGMAPLPVVFSTGAAILADLGSTSPGTYVVTVSTGPATTQTYSVDVTIGTVGPQGPEGPEGPEGPQGIQGEKGDKGDQGDKGDKGDQGLKGDKGDKGDQGDKGDKGAQGIQGVQGIQGIQGVQGPAGAGISVGAFVNPDGTVQFASQGVTVTKTGTGKYDISIAPGTFSALAIPMYMPFGDTDVIGHGTNGLTHSNVTFDKDALFHFLMVQVKP